MVTGYVYSSWGNNQGRYRSVFIPKTSASAILPDESYLAYGNGRSYGDTCLPAGDTIIDTRAMKSVLKFDQQNGILRAEAGISLSEILDIIIPHGWFLPVTPGTSAVTLAGATANDVHGKNHHIAGTFGRFVRSLELLRSHAGRMVCSPTSNQEMFAATIGGMGLTGLITWVEISLMPVHSPDVEVIAKRFANLDSFFAQEQNDDAGFTYSVAWIDGFARGASFGRGLILLGNHAGRPESGAMPAAVRRKLRIPVPLTAPCNVVFPPALRLLNELYFRQNGNKRRVSCDKFFYPLDTVSSWNRLYGPRGFRQFQCVVPSATARNAITDLLTQAHTLAGGSGLAVLKKFGGHISPGLLSFPRPGYTLTLDFPNQGDATDQLFHTLNKIAIDAGGRINPYKDSSLTTSVFQASFPEWRRILPYLDSNAESRFSRRLGITGAPANTCAV